MSTPETLSVRWPVAVIGLGRIGQALQTALQVRPEAMVGVWDTDQTKVSQEEKLCNIIGAARVIFLCIPSSEVAVCLKNLNPDLTSDSVVVSVIKGLDPASHQTMHELLNELLPSGVHHALLGGPMLSAEITRGLPARGIVGASREVYEQLHELCQGTTISLAHTTDEQGVAVAGVLKNVYALGLGIADALELGDNARGWLVAQALSEMAVLIEAWGGDRATAYSLAGVGDLIATGTSPHSKNRTAGKELITHGRIATLSEGYVSLPLLCARLGDLTPYPLLNSIQRVVRGQHSAREEFSNFFFSGTAPASS